MRTLSIVCAGLAGSLAAQQLPLPHGAVVSLPLQENTRLAVVFGDLDGDGRRDAVMGQGTQLAVALGTPAGFGERRPIETGPLAEVFNA